MHGPLQVFGEGDPGRKMIHLYPLYWGHYTANPLAHITMTKKANLVGGKEKKDRKISQNNVVQNYSLILTNTV